MFGGASLGGRIRRGSVKFGTWKKVYFRRSVECDAKAVDLSVLTLAFITLEPSSRFIVISVYPIPFVFSYYSYTSRRERLSSSKFQIDRNLTFFKLKKKKIHFTYCEKIENYRWSLTLMTFLSKKKKFSIALKIFT